MSDNNDNVQGNKEQNSSMEKSRNWLTVLILCWFTGFFGIHRMYAGKVASGIFILYGTILSACIMYFNFILGLVAFTIMGAIVVNDFLRIATKTFKDCNGNYIVEDKIN